MLSVKLKKLKSDGKNWCSCCGKTIPDGKDSELYHKSRHISFEHFCDFWNFGLDEIYLNKYLESVTNGKQNQ